MSSKTARQTVSTSCACIHMLSSQVLWCFGTSSCIYFAMVHQFQRHHCLQQPCHFCNKFACCNSNTLYTVKPVKRHGERLAQGSMNEQWVSSTSSCLGSKDADWGPRPVTDCNTCCRKAVGPSSWQIAASVSLEPSRRGELCS